MQHNALSSVPGHVIQWTWKPPRWCGSWLKRYRCTRAVLGPSDIWKNMTEISNSVIKHIITRVRMKACFWLVVVRAFKPFNARSSGCQGDDSRFLPDSVFVTTLISPSTHGHQHHVSLVSGKRPIYKGIKHLVGRHINSFNALCGGNQPPLRVDRFFASAPGVKTV